MLKNASAAAACSAISGRMTLDRAQQIIDGLICHDERSAVLISPELGRQVDAGSAGLRRAE
jgi:hypothetical protein